MIPAHSIADADCLRVATASLLELNPRRMPHFIRRPGNWLDVWQAWLNARGLRIRTHYFRTLADAPKGYWIAIVDEDPTDGWSHALVMRGRRVAHDLYTPKGERRKYVCGYTIEPA